MASHVKQLLSYIRWTRLHEDISHWDYMVFTPCQLRIKDNQIQFEKLILGITITWNLVLYSQHPVPLSLPSPLLSLCPFLPISFPPALHFTTLLIWHPILSISSLCPASTSFTASSLLLQSVWRRILTRNITYPCPAEILPDRSVTPGHCVFFLSVILLSFHGHPGRKAFDTKTMILTFVSLRHWLGQGLLPGTGC